MKKEFVWFSCCYNKPVWRFVFMFDCKMRIGKQLLIVWPKIVLFFSTSSWNDETVCYNRLLINGYLFSKEKRPTELVNELIEATVQTDTIVNFLKLDFGLQMLCRATCFLIFICHQSLLLFKLKKNHQANQSNIYYYFIFIKTDFCFWRFPFELNGRIFWKKTS